MSNRRTFLRNAALASLTSQVFRQMHCKDYKIGTEVNWPEIKRLFLPNSKGILNFNTGSAGLMPYPILENYKENINILHGSAPYEIYENSKPIILKAQHRLAVQLDTTADQLALIRNTTQGINLILWGIQFKQGDEVICSDIDYPYLINTLKSIAKAKGLLLKVIKMDLRQDDDATIVDKYTKAIGPKTRLMVLTHMTHREGYILPIKKLCSAAHSQNVEVLLDAAHAAGQIDHSITNLNCDYYITSLHKWMHAPLGTGLVYIKKALLPKVRPPMSYPMSQEGSMNKFSYIGTVNFANQMSLPSVLDFHEQLGIDRKQKRLKALSRYFIDGAKSLKHISIYTPPDKMCGMVSFSVAGANLTKLVNRLQAQYKIHLKKTRTSTGANILRASFNIHLDLNDIDRLLIALEDIQ